MTKQDKHRADRPARRLPWLSLAFAALGIWVVFTALDVLWHAVRMALIVVLIGAVIVLAARIAHRPNSEE